MSPRTVSRGAANVLEPSDPEDLAAVVVAHRGCGIAVTGGATKPRLVPPARAGAPVLSTRRLTGIASYEPSEFTVTAYAGTPVARLDRALAEHRQALPFDPPFARSGATLGGAIAAGLAGAGRVRFGGARDFVLAIRFVDGRGRRLRGGAGVVKNAAGFDLPKLLVGSLGRLAVLTDITFKVLPRPAATLSARFVLPRLEDALDALVRLAAGPFDLAALELQPPATLLVRLGGPAASLPQRIERLAREIDTRAEHLEGAAEIRVWRDLAELDDLVDDGADDSGGRVRVHVAAAPRRLAELVAACTGFGAGWRIGGGGAALWLAVGPAHLDALDQALDRLGCSGLVLIGPEPSGVGGDPRIGRRTGDALLRRLRGVFDPDDTFPRWSFARGPEAG